jgi:hypothetical protein
MNILDVPENIFRVPADVFPRFAVFDELSAVLLANSSRRARQKFSRVMAAAEIARRVDLPRAVAAGSYAVILWLYAAG